MPSLCARVLPRGFLLTPLPHPQTTVAHIEEQLLLLKAEAEAMKSEVQQARDVERAEQRRQAAEAQREQVSAAELRPWRRRITSCMGGGGPGGGRGHMK